MNKESIKQVQAETERIEKELIKNSDILLNNTNHFTRKFRGTEELDVHLSFRADYTYDTRVVINLYVGNEDTKMLSKYIVKDSELINKEINYGHGNKRIHNTHR
jgi:hypothetical protein